MKQFSIRNRLAYTGGRLADWLLGQPARWRRLGKHLTAFPGAVRGAWPGMGLEPGLAARIGIWISCGVILIGDMLALPEVYEILTIWLKWNIRPLNSREKALASELFGGAIRPDRVLIDERAWVGPRQKRFCYVSFFTVNSWGPMGDVLLIHELVHVWQYERWGSAYIPLALAAQRSKAGYNYGGMPALAAAIAQGKELGSFNPEQQADIIADAFCCRRGLPLRWEKGPAPDERIYVRFLEQLVC